MVCQGLQIMGDNLEIADFLVYPTTCFYHTWAVILFGIFVSLAFILYNHERDNQIKPDIISILGVSSTAILLLAIIMTLIESTNGLPMLQQDLFLYVVAFWVVLSGLWFFKK